MRWLLLLLVAMSMQIHAADFNYRLKPVLIAPDTYLVEGAREDFSFENGGNISNSAFVITGAGVVVIDTGPSRRYGEQLRRVIEKMTDQPIVKVFNTHLHPDHTFGNQAFTDIEIVALPETKRGMAAQMDTFADNLYRLAGFWMQATEPVAPTATISASKVSVGKHRFSFTAMAGHTDGDLVLLDETTGVLFIGDLVFNQRGVATSHADIPTWINALDHAAKIPFKLLVPGHGAVTNNVESIAATKRYLVWLNKTLRTAAERGLSMTEVMALPLPADYAAWPLARNEYNRSVVHLYPGLEEKKLQRVSR